MTGSQLVQSRNAGHIHHPTCGHRSLYITYLEGSENMTRAQQIETYGTALCEYCFPEVAALKVAARKVATPVSTKEYCEGSGSYRRPEYQGGNWTICGTCNKKVRVNSDSWKIRKH